MPGQRFGRDELVRLRRKRPVSVSAAGWMRSSAVRAVCCQVRGNSRSLATNSATIGHAAVRPDKSQPKIAFTALHPAPPASYHPPLVFEHDVKMARELYMAGEDPLVSRAPTACTAPGARVSTCT